MMSNRPGGGSGSRGFSLLEMLAATVVFLLLIGIVLKMTQATADSWSSSTGKTEGFRDARMAFATITRALSQATLNTYFDYANAGGDFRDTATGVFAPSRYLRRSDLHFVTGKSLLQSSVTNPVTHAIFFQAPLGYTRTATYSEMNGLLNACGFYVCYGADPDIPTSLAGVLPVPKRFRLMQFLQPSENLAIYDDSVTGNKANWSSTKWFTDAMGQSDPPVSQLAENVVAMVVYPKYSEKDEDAKGILSDNYEYDSRTASSAGTHNQLPPVVEVILVVIDETSASRLGDGSSPPNLGLDSLFKEASKLDADLAAFEKNLGALPGNMSGNTIPLRYQIFRTEVALRGSKWSTN